MRAKYEFVRGGNEMAGKVFLVGAGPGDMELLTIKGKRLLEEADVVVYDRLVSAEIMDLIPEEAELINVGKNVGDHPVPQHEINRILLREAEAGKKVVRLKGGDPFVFGRGGEELELLAEKGVEFEVVPGITSSISAPAYAGIPVTHRDYCSSVHIITGHGKKDSEVEIDFDALVRLKGTLVFMMSVKTIGRLSAGLMKAGMEKSMPAAVIENGTRAEQRKFVSDLEHIEETVRENKVKSPAVIMVGKVCQLSDSFDWFDTKPLKGRKFIVTQPQRRTSKLDMGLKNLGAETLLYPCIETKYIRPIAPEYEKADVLVFTSREGVASFFDYLFSEEGKDARAVAGKKIAAVGRATARALREYGLTADFIPSVFDGEHLAEEMIEQGFVDKDSNVLMLRAEWGSEDMNKVLDKAGIKYEDYKVYRTFYVNHEPLTNLEEYDYITFTSKSCVYGFVKTQGREDYKGVKALCIGKQTEEAAEQFGFDIIVSDEASIESMIEKVRSEIK